MAFGLTWHLPLWTALPFVVLLLAIAVLPLCAPHWWEKNGNKLKVALLCGAPAAIFVVVKARELGIPFTLHDHPLLLALHEYATFMLVLLALYVISGGIHVKGTLAGTPLVNTSILTFGAVIASVVGTTGASMLLIRPLLRANAARRRRTHVVVFFIFIVANCGGLLTPLGDPPLFLGFLRGVPFTWTFSLWKAWLLVNGALLVLFQMIDSHYFHREDIEERRDLDEAVERRRKPLRIEGGVNFLLLAGVVGVVYFSGRQGWGSRWPGLQEAALLGLALASLFLTKKAVRERNSFTWGPIVEVACLFLGIFLAMIPALRILHDAGDELGIASPRAFFWATGLLSAFLDNAPTYLTFTSVAAGMEKVAAEGPFLAAYLDPARDGAAEAAKILAAISCGAVFMGATTYIGNGPNFMVKAIAQASGVRMPGFLGFMAWSGAILIPLFVVVTFVIF